MKPKKREKKPGPAQQFLEALADVIADRVAAKIADSEKLAPIPEKVPLWLSGPKQPRGKKRPPIQGEWTIDKALRNAGLLKYGDRGYKEALDEYLQWKRKHDAELHARAQMRKAVKVFERLLDRVARG